VLFRSAAAEKVVADKVAADARAAEEVVIEAQRASAALAVTKAAASRIKLKTNKTGFRLNLNLPDKHYGQIVNIYVGTTKNGKTTYKKLDFFVLENEDATAKFSSKVKLVKGQIVRVNVGKTVVRSIKVK
jgi:hypothetical protein